MDRDLELTQDVYSGLGASGNFTNSVRWTLEQNLADNQNGDSLNEAVLKVRYSGRLDVQAVYNVTSKGDLMQSLSGHLLVPDEDSDVPEDIEGLVMAMQRSMPIDLFDPSDLFIHHTVSV